MIFFGEQKFLISVVKRLVFCFITSAFGVLFKKKSFLSSRATSIFCSMVLEHTRHSCGKLLATRQAGLPSAWGPWELCPTQSIRPPKNKMGSAECLRRSSPRKPTPRECPGESKHLYCFYFVPKDSGYTSY